VFLYLLHSTDGFCASFDSLTQKLNILAKRDEVLSKNIANANTPNYSPLDINTAESMNNDFFTLNVTHPGHLNSSNGNEFNIREAEVLEIKPDGNKVTLEHELFKKRENTSEIEQVTKTFSKMKTLHGIALSVSSK
ncbi:MAG: hypothetical protein O3C05_01045, partial [Proteobacteria bacterium]|nr:hypothetical protein [Pseudomonadota bacterium]